MNGLERWEGWRLATGCLGSGNYSPDRSSELENVQLSPRILPKRADKAARRDQPAPVARVRRIARIPDAVDRPVTIIGIEIVAVEHRQRAAVIHIAARDRTGPEAVRVLDDRQHADRRAGIGRKAVVPFHNIPPKIGAAPSLHRGG